MFVLQLNNAYMLAEMAILAGNDFTRAYTRQLKSRVGVYSKDIGEVAKWVQSHKRLENHQVIAQEMVCINLLLIHVLVIN